MLFEIGKAFSKFVAPKPILVVVFYNLKNANADPKRDYRRRPC
jgi:hypothetical protein